MVEIVLRMDPDMPAAQTLHKAVQEATARRSERSVVPWIHPTACCCMYCLPSKPKN